MLRGDNMSAVHWVKKGGGKNGPRVGVLCRLVGVLESDSIWGMVAAHVQGKLNTVADSISRVAEHEVTPQLQQLDPGTQWRRSQLTSENLLMITSLLDGTWPEEVWETQLWRLIRPRGVSG